MSFRLLLLSLISISACVCGIAQNNPGVVSGKVMSFDGEAIDYAIVYTKVRNIPVSLMSMVCII